MGEPAPAWADLPGVNGRRHALDELNDKDVVVVAFTSNTCPVALGYVGRVKAFVDRHARQGDRVGLVAINVNIDQPDEDLAAMRSHATAEAFNFPYLLDRSQQVGMAYGVITSPEFFVLDRDRRVRYRGEMDDHQVAERATHNYVEEAVRALLAGKSPDVTRTWPHGCLVNYPVRKDGSFRRAEMSR